MASPAWEDRTKGSVACESCGSSRPFFTDDAGFHICVDCGQQQSDIRQEFRDEEDVGFELTGIRDSEARVGMGLRHRTLTSVTYGGRRRRVWDDYSGESDYDSAKERAALEGEWTKKPPSEVDYLRALQMILESCANRMVNVFGITPVMVQECRKVWFRVLQLLLEFDYPVSTAFSSCKIRTSKIGVRRLYSPVLTQPDPAVILEDESIPVAVKRVVNEMGLDRRDYVQQLVPCLAKEARNDCKRARILSRKVVRIKRRKVQLCRVDGSRGRPSESVTEETPTQSTAAATQLPDPDREGETTPLKAPEVIRIKKDRRSSTDTGLKDAVSSAATGALPPAGALEVVSDTIESSLPQVKAARVAGQDSGRVEAVAVQGEDLAGFDRAPADTLPPPEDKDVLDGQDEDGSWLELAPVEVKELKVIREATLRHEVACKNAQIDPPHYGQHVTYRKPPRYLREDPENRYVRVSQETREKHGEQPVALEVLLTERGLARGPIQITPVNSGDRQRRHSMRPKGAPKTLIDGDWQIDAIYEHDFLCRYIDANAFHFDDERAVVAEPGAGDNPRPSGDEIENGNTLGIDPSHLPPPVDQAESDAPIVAEPPHPPFYLDQGVTQEQLRKWSRNLAELTQSQMEKLLEERDPDVAAGVDELEVFGVARVKPPLAAETTVGEADGLNQSQTPRACVRGRLSVFKHAPLRHEMSAQAAVERMIRAWLSQMKRSDALRDIENWMGSLRRQRPLTVLQKGGVETPPDGRVSNQEWTSSLASSDHSADESNMSPLAFFLKFSTSSLMSTHSDSRERCPIIGSPDPPNGLPFLRFALPLLWNYVTEALRGVEPASSLEGLNPDISSSLATLRCVKDNLKQLSEQLQCQQQLSRVSNLPLLRSLDAFYLSSEWQRPRIRNFLEMQTLASCKAGPGGEGLASLPALSEFLIPEVSTSRIRQLTDDEIIGCLFSIFSKNGQRAHLLLLSLIRQTVTKVSKHRRLALRSSLLRKLFRLVAPAYMVKSRLYEDTDDSATPDFPSLDYKCILTVIWIALLNTRHAVLARDICRWVEIGSVGLNEAIDEIPEWLFEASGPRRSMQFLREGVHSSRAVPESLVRDRSALQLQTTIKPHELESILMKLTRLGIEVANFSHVLLVSRMLHHSRLPVYLQPLVVGLVDLIEKPATVMQDGFGEVKGGGGGPVSQIYGRIGPFLAPIAVAAAVLMACRVEWPIFVYQPTGKPGNPSRVVTPSDVTTPRGSHGRPYLGSPSGCFGEDAALRDPELVLYEPIGECCTTQITEKTDNSLNLQYEARTKSWTVQYKDASSTFNADSHGFLGAGLRALDWLKKKTTLSSAEFKSFLSSLGGAKSGEGLGPSRSADRSYSLEPTAKCKGDSTEQHFLELLMSESRRRNGMQGLCLLLRDGAMPSNQEIFHTLVTRANEPGWLDSLAPWLFSSDMWSHASPRAKGELLRGAGYWLCRPNLARSRFGTSALGLLDQLRMSERACDRKTAHRSQEEAKQDFTLTQDTEESRWDDPFAYRSSACDTFEEIAATYKPSAYLFAERQDPTMAARMQDEIDAFVRVKGSEAECEVRALESGAIKSMESSVSRAARPHGRGGSWGESVVDDLDDLYGHIYSAYLQSIRSGFQEPGLVTECWHPVDVASRTVQHDPPFDAYRLPVPYLIVLRRLASFIDADPRQIHSTLQCIERWLFLTEIPARYCQMVEAEKHGQPSPTDEGL